MYFSEYFFKNVFQTILKKHIIILKYFYTFMSRQNSFLKAVHISNECIIWWYQCSKSCDRPSSYKQLYCEFRIENHLAEAELY